MKPSERTFARRIDLTSLQLFVAVCELGSIGRAAEREFIAASAVSKRLSDLEATLDTPLLYRHTRGVDLTPAGESLLHHARSVLFSLEKMQGELSEYADGVRGHVRVHANISAIVQFLPEDLGAFTREHDAGQDRPGRAPQHRGGARRAGRRRRPRHLQRRRRGNGHELQTLPYRQDQLVLIVPRGHPLARSKARRFRGHAGLATTSACTPTARSTWPCTRPRAAAGRTIKLRIHVTGLDAMCRMIDNGLGVGVMPLRAFELMHGVGRPGMRARSPTPGPTREHPPGRARFLHPAGHGAPAGRPPARPAEQRPPRGSPPNKIITPRRKPPMARTLYDKIWDEHVVHTEEDGTAILYIDRHLVHEVTSPQAFEGLREAGRKVWRISSVVATADHNTPTTDWERGYDGITDPISKEQITTLDNNIGEFGVGRLLPVPVQAPGHRARDRPRAGRHAAGHDGGLRRLAHLHARRLRRAGARHRHQRGRARDGHADPAGQEGEEHADQGRGQAAAAACTAKDIVLAIIGRIGTAGGTGYTIEFAGSAIRALSMEGRMTVCNMAIEAGARAGLVAVDEKTIDYVKGRPLAPTGVEWDQAVAYWKTLQSDPDAKFDTVVELDADADHAAGHLGHLARDGVGRGRPRARPRQGKGRQQARRHRARADLHGPGARQADERHLRRQGVHRLVHQQPHRGHARGRGRGQEAGPEGREERQAGDGGAGLGPGEGTGRARRPGRDLQGRGLRMARARLLDVPGHERRPAGAGRALRLDQQPQFRRPPGRRRPHPPGQPRHGRRRRGARPFRRRPSIRLRRNP